MQVSPLEPENPYRYPFTKTTPPWWFFISLVKYSSCALTSPFWAFSPSRAAPVPYSEVKKTLLSAKTGVAQLAVRLAGDEWRHISLPSPARTPTAAREVKFIIVRTPPTSAAMADE